MTGTSHRALYERFLRGLAVAPEKPAVRLGSETITFERAHRLALRWAGALLRSPSGPPAAVGVLGGKSAESYVGILAVLYSGATVVPLHPDFPASRTRRMLEVADVSSLIVDGVGLRRLPEIFGDELDLPVLVPDADVDGGSLRLLPLDEAGALDEPRPVEASDVAYMLFTSGSTGRPKGVPITHGNATSYFDVLDKRYDFTPDDVFTQTFDLNFDCGMFDLFCAWGAGASVTVVPPHAYRDIPKFLAEVGVTVWFSTPSSIALIRRMGGLEAGSMPTLRWSFFAGEALRCSDTADWQRAAPGSVVENLYGPTELTVTITGHRWSHEESMRRAINGMVPIGAVHEGHEAILLGEAGEIVEDEGELCITGPQMAGGYLDPEDDAGRFHTHDSRRWYRTGDRVRRLDNGEYAYLGRLDSQVQLNGWRVELPEIEHALRSCAGVEDAVTVTRPTETGTELVVFYTGTEISPAVLSRQLRDILPQGMLPRQYRHLAEFPLNSNRKIDRGRLTREAAEPSDAATRS